MANTILNPSAFYAGLRSKGPVPSTERLATSFNTVQVQAIDALLAATTNWPLPWVAYALATAWHECRFKPVEETGKGRGKPYGKPGKYGQSQHGRGLVQLTWDYNYEWADEALGLGGALLRDFNLALDPAIATKILVLGMEAGAFTTHSLEMYLPRSRGVGSRNAYRKARKIINGTDKADMIAGYALVAERALVSGGWGDNSAPVFVPPAAAPVLPAAPVDAATLAEVSEPAGRETPAPDNRGSIGSDTMLKSKTTWTSIAALVAAVGAFATGEATMVEAGIAAVVALTALFQRHATAKLAEQMGTGLR